MRVPSQKRDTQLHPHMEACITAQKTNFSFGIYSVNITKSAAICVFCQIYWRNP